MATAVDIDQVQVIDTDTHVTEPADLWSSRLASKWRDVAPRVEVHPDTGHHHWRVGDTWLLSVGYFARAGWPHYPPVMPNEFDEIDPGAWRPSDRLKRMDEYGLFAQVLYPNLIGFETPVFTSQGSEFATACTRAYNDFLVEFCQEDSRRLIPIAMVPFWDMEAATQEILRCQRAGHHGILFANRYEDIGLPSFVDPHWDPVYSLAQDLDLSINFHIGFSSARDAKSNAKVLMERNKNYDARIATRDASIAVMSNASTIATLLTSGLCDRFPRLKFVSVESGFGYVPYLLDSLDWHWKGDGAHLQSPVLPSEIFLRQCYGTFWFETSTLELLQKYPDNFMFETDYPHPTSMSPGPASPAEIPIEHIRRVFNGIDAETAVKALHGNAARVYNLDN